VISRGIVLSPAHDSHGKKDVTYAFRPEAHRFATLHDCTHVEIDNRGSMPARRKRVVEAIRGARYDAYATPIVAIFCHGWRDGIQLGVRVRDVDELAAAIAEATASAATIVALYCCDTAQGVERGADTSAGPGGDGGFADELRDALCRAGVEWTVVDAHVTTGHTTRNPNLRRFGGEGSKTGGSGGGWIVRPRSRLWKPWAAALRRTDMRLRFPVLTVPEIHAELTA